ncbi:hypothetical protein [Candidatus Sororendozoicomonas aggregata]|uniref:hypothetical protein n=1 Tax=Candidatus Sororendozoicomonas aggregata TaxID=3073239 RepID=UPI002ED071C8
MMIQFDRWAVFALIVLTPSVVLAANNPPEPTSGSSSGDFAVGLQVLPLARIGFPSALTNVDFGDFNASFGFQEQQQGFCIFHNTRAVRLVAESQRGNVSGLFMLAHSSAPASVSPADPQGIEYQIEILSNGSLIGNGALRAGTPTPDFAAANARETDVPACSDATANMRLRLSLANNVDFEQKNVGGYRDELTLTVTAE